MPGAYRFSVIAGSSLALAACSLVTSLDGLAGPGVGDGGADADRDANLLAEAGDASRETRDAAVGEGGDDAGVNLHPNGTLESGCSSWAGFHGTIAPSATAHSGNGSCVVCTKPTTTDYFTADDSAAIGDDIAGATYAVEAWVRAQPGSPTPNGVSLVLRNNDPNFGPSIESRSSPEVQIDANWQRLETQLDITKQGKLNVYIAGNQIANACFLFDDVVVQRVK